MTVEELNHWLQDPSALSVDTLPEVCALVEDYPYFSLGTVLYLKNLAQIQDASFSKELERLAIRVPDRRSLYSWITNEEWRCPAVDQPVEEKPADDTFSLIDAFLKNHAAEEQADPSLLFQPSASSDYLHWSILHEQQSGETGVDEPKLRHQDLIDSFIANEEKMLSNRNLLDPNTETPAETPESIRLLEAQPKSLEESCLTETLARIYIKQKRYEKAVQIIQNLHLKYPEKSRYFADQIRFLEKLIINTKK